MDLASAKARLKLARDRLGSVGRYGSIDRVTSLVRLEAESLRVFEAISVLTAGVGAGSGVRLVQLVVVSAAALVEAPAPDGRAVFPGTQYDGGNAATRSNRANMAKRIDRCS